MPIYSQNHTKNACKYIITLRYNNLRILTIVDDTAITSLQSECLAVYLHFKSLSSWISFIDKYLTGQITHAFLPLQEELRKQPGLENVELDVVVYENDFIRSVKQIGTP